MDGDPQPIKVDSREERSLPGVVIPDQLKANFRNSVSFLASEIQGINPALIVCFQRSGSMLFEVFRGWAGRHNFTLPDTIDLPIGRDFADRFSAATGTSLDAGDEEVYQAYRGWLKEDQKASEIIGLLKDHLSKVGSPDKAGGSPSILFVDDTKSPLGTTYLTGQLLLEHARADLGIADISSKLFLFAPPFSWQNEILEATFKPVIGRSLTGLEEKLLQELLLGAHPPPGEQADTWLRELGGRILTLFGVEDRNPAESIAEFYSPEQLLQLHEKVKEALRQCVS